MSIDVKSLALDHAWKYFSLHSNQRMSVFNFYLILVGLITAGIVQTFLQDFPIPIVGAVLGILLSFTSFIFWKLDTRTRFLINRAEEAMRSLEDIADLNFPDKAKIFTREEELTFSLQKTKMRMLTYGVCLRIVFLVFGVLGSLSALLSLVRSL